MIQEEGDVYDKHLREIEVQYEEALDILATDDGVVSPRRRFKCPICYSIVDETPCPMCGYATPAPMCRNDHVCTCLHPISEKIRFCDVCGSAICPCGCHDVEVHTRITGYINALSGFNAGKAQEVKDRVRNNIRDGSWKRANGKDD